MKHLGNICKINGAEVEPVDVVIGGSPCQDLSVAGKRAGLDGERSGLFMEQIALNIDCMEYMKGLPDKVFDLAIVDPPYGGGKMTLGQGKSGADLAGGLTDIKLNVTHATGGRFQRYEMKSQGGIFKTCQHWDIAPEEDFFIELFRVSKNQIIWGGNYFDLPPTRCFLVWRKLTISEDFSMAMCEYAWTSFNDNAKLFECVPQGNTEKRIHPTQKPISLYEWTMRRYAKAGDKILDTHLGSGSSRMAAYNLSLDFVGCEIDKDYFEMQEKRFKEHTAQVRLEDTFKGLENMSLF